MTSPTQEAVSLLAIDVGTITTRAILFGVVDGRYRFVAAGSSPTTAGAPFGDIREGIHRALTHLQQITGREFMDGDGHLITPSSSDARGVDACVATISAGQPMKVVVVGLLEDVSVESATRLAKTLPARVVDRISLTDRRKPAARLDAILRARPDLIIVSGGTEGGASHSVLSQLEAVGLACYQIAEQQRPELLYVGNQALAADVKQAIGTTARLTTAPNIRPSLDVEQFGPAQSQLAEIFARLRSRSMPGLAEISNWSMGRVLPTSSAFGRILRFLSRFYPAGKGVLGVDVGASSTTLAGAFGGELVMGVYPELGTGSALTDMASQGSLQDVLRWLSFDLPEADLRSYMLNKALFPTAIPATQEALEIEQALARQAMQWAVTQLYPRFPLSANRAGPGLMPWVEPVFASGSVITNAPTRAQSLLMILDGLQPAGVTTIVMDQNGVLSALGAAASANTVLPIHLLDSSTFLNLATVVAPVGRAQYGAPAIRVRVGQSGASGGSAASGSATSGGQEKSIEIKYGAIEIIPVPLGQKVSLHLQPLNRFDVGMGGPGRGGGVTVTGGVLGVVIDARGRPLRLPEDPARRRELFKKWRLALGDKTGSLAASAPPDASAMPGKAEKPAQGEKRRLGRKPSAPAQPAQEEQASQGDQPGPGDQPTQDDQPGQMIKAGGDSKT